MNADPSRQQMHRRYRRRILGWGAAALLIVLVLGSVITLPRVESELENRVDAAAVAAGLDGVTSSFSGQDGTLRCVAPGDLPDDELLDELRELRGVNTIELGDGCGSTDTDDADALISDTTGETQTTEPDATTASTEAPSTTPTTATGDTEPSDDGEVTDSALDVVRNDSQFSTLSELIDDSGIGTDLRTDGPITLFAPTDDAFQALGPDVIAALGRDPDLLAAVLRHHATAGNLPAEDFERGDIEMLDGTAVSISPGEAAVDAAITSGDVTAAITAGDIIATNGVVHAVDTVLLPPGFELPAASATVPDSDVADVADAEALEAELNEFVFFNPILFEPGSADIAAASQPVIDQIAVLAGQLSGISIEVQGHTDTDGNPDRNQTLSENRASSVRDALIAAGLDADGLTSNGFGGTRTIVDAAGVEDKAASRRVDFVVTTG